MSCHCRESGVQCIHRPEQAHKIRTFPNNEKNPPYLPQPSDEFASAEPEVESMGRIGPWATGRLWWSPTAELTGVRPVVDRYSITRYSLKDWRKKNQEALDFAFSTSQLKENVKCTMNNITAGADKHQSQNTTRLEVRVKEVRDCQSEMESLIKDFREEIVLLTELKIKLKFSLPALKIPESIAGECIDRRTTRLEPDLVNDDVEIQLVKELALIKETRDLYGRVIEEIERQMQANRACKDQLEHTWSDKKETCELESINACLRNTTPIIMNHGGAARIPENQSSPESWAIFNATLINTAKDELQKSRSLRKTAETTVIQESIKELQSQADKVYKALTKRIEETDQCRQMFERELQDVLRQIAEAESLYDGLLKLQRQLDYNTKVVETRLDNRLQRPRVENCRDEPQYGSSYGSWNHIATALSNATSRPISLIQPVTQYSEYSAGNSVLLQSFVETRSNALLNTLAMFRPTANTTPSLNAAVVLRTVKMAYILVRFFDKHITLYRH